MSQLLDKKDHRVCQEKSAPFLHHTTKVNSNKNLSFAKQVFALLSLNASHFNSPACHLFSLWQNNDKLNKEASIQFRTRSLLDTSSEMNMEIPPGFSTGFLP